MIGTRFTKTRCPRCGGNVYFDEDDDPRCFQCGRLYVKPNPDWWLPKGAMLFLPLPILQLKSGQRVGDCSHLAFNNFIHLYIRHLRAECRCSSNYIKQSRFILQRYSRFLQNEGISSILNTDKHTWRNFTAHLIDRHFCKATIAGYQSALRNFYKYLFYEFILPRNPFEGLHSPKLDKRLPHFLNLEEVEGLIEAVEQITPQGQRDRAIIELLYATGVRVSELVSVNTTDIDFANNEIRIWGKGAKERIVLFGESAYRAMLTYLIDGRPKFLNRNNTQALFLGCMGKRLDKGMVARDIKKYATIAGITKRVYPHLLRHSFATHLLDRGCDLLVVSELLGHTSLSATEIYTHISQVHLRNELMKAHPLARGE